MHGRVRQSGDWLVLTKAIAIDHGPAGTRVNGVCPGDVQTPMLPDEAVKQGIPWEDCAAGAALRPLGRIGTAEEVAEVVLILSSEKSSFLTGTALVVDGGGIAG
jgi:NAD(P)-dependent dehydrogenase (short-subunit alcohol dehydrogenase family)